MTKDKFTLEQQILDCWGVTNDLETLFEAVMEKDLSVDTIANIVLGLKELYHLKFEKTFETFEELVSEGKL